MNENMLLPAVIFLPMIGALIGYVVGRKNKTMRDYIADSFAALEFLLVIYLFFMYLGGKTFTFYWESFGIQGMYFELDGFRMIMILVTAFMWLMVTVFSRQYMAHYRNRNRYYLFLMLTLGGVMGVFLSADLLTTFLFFEMLSFTSFVWVAHDETKEAMRAATTYLGVAVIGGLVMLMGLMLLQYLTGTLIIAELTEACMAVENRGLLLTAGGCLLFGFGAKAGMFPLHIWLPKAHPVAPAPASALLSGILTKSGIFGVIIVSCQIFYQNMYWGKFLILIGLVTMVLGALLAVFSMDLKKILACSSVSQIGFILIGIGMQDLLGSTNELAISGTMLHMVNHSLFKLVLFLCAGVVFMNLHKLHLNDIRGFGRNKGLLKTVFAIGALGIGGIPLFSGYISKTLLHESIVEYAIHAASKGYGALSATGTGWVEWLFILSGGMTVAYMLKIFIAVFIERHPEQQKYMDGMKKSYINAQGAVALLVPAVVIVLFGVLPNVFMEKIARMGQSFMNAGHVGEAIHYFSWINLKGAFISLVIGLIIYFGVIRTLLMYTDEKGRRQYIDRWPVWMDLENRIYRPFLLTILANLLGFVCRVFDYFTDGIVLLCRKTTHKSIVERRKIYVGTPITDFFGRILDNIVKVINKTIRKNRPITTSYIYLFAEWGQETTKTTRMITASLSFGLLLFCIGFCMTLFYLLF